MTKEQNFKEWLLESTKDLYEEFKDTFKAKTYIAPPKVLLKLLLEPLLAISILTLIGSSTLKSYLSSPITSLPIFSIFLLSLLHFMYRADKIERKYKGKW